jgi:AGZA family xanthine/uracil permease-like MFS transporter
MAKSGLHAAGLGAPGRPFSDAIIAEFLKSDTWIQGAFAIEQGFLFTAMLLSAAVVGVIERRWTVAAAWCAIAAVLSATGLMHSYQWTPSDTALKLTPAWPFVIGYGAMAVTFLVAKWTTEEGGEH